MKITNVYAKSKEVIELNSTLTAIYTELIAEGFKVFVNRYGLKVSGKRTSWQEGYWMAFLGWKKGQNPPKIIRTYLKK